MNQDKLTKAQMIRAMKKDNAKMSSIKRSRLFNLTHANVEKIYLEFLEKEKKENEE